MVFDVEGNQYREHWKVSGSEATMHIGLDTAEPGYGDAFDAMGITTTSAVQDNVTVVANRQRLCPAP